MTKNKLKIDFFRDGMSIFLAYIARQFKKNPDYKPHPIIRAFECALPGMDKVKQDECTMGISHDGPQGSVCNPYIVVLQKKEDGIEVKEIRNVSVNKELPLDIMILIFRLQIHLDRIEGDTVSPEEMANTLNKVIPGNRFYVLGDRWKEACDKFKKLLGEGKIRIPNDPELIKELSKIRYDIPWDQYSNRLRSLIGSSIAPSFSKEGGIVIITSPKNSKIEKFKVFDTATEFMLGKTAEYLKPFSKK